MKLRKTKKGFTIVELVIVVGVIGILSAVLIPTFVNLTENAKKNAELLEVRDAYAAYVAEAVDGVLDADGTTAIAYKEQDKVELHKSTKVYHWDGSKWVSGALATAADTFVVAGNETASTFNGWSVKYKA